MEPLGRPALPREKEHIIPANDHILDDATTLLAALRMGKEFPETEPKYGLEKRFLTSARHSQKSICQNQSRPKNFSKPRAMKPCKMLTDAWLKSEAFNELRMIPGLIFEGEWKNQPRATREFLLNLLDAIPKGKWWSISAFIQNVKEKYPDFQRPAGDYDSWFIQARIGNGDYLRGFENWDHVDGTLARFFISPILSLARQSGIGAPWGDGACQRVQGAKQVANQCGT